MGILDKVMFWKKKDDFSDLGLGGDFNLGGDDLGLAGNKSDALSGASGLGRGISKSRQDVSSSPSSTYQDSSYGVQDMEQPTGMYGSSEDQYSHNNLQDDYGQASAMHKPVQQSAPPTFNQASHPQYNQYSPSQSHTSASSQEIQLISAKLDAIKAYLDTINQRLTNIENMSRG